MSNLKNIKSIIFDKIKKNPKIILIIGLIGIGLIFLSNFIKTDDKVVQTSSKITTSEYCETLENQLCEQISQVVGGDVTVMITLKTGVEFVYASEVKDDESEIEDNDSQDSQKVQKDKKSEKNYILYKDENGSEVPLVVTEIMPQIKGVVVSCENGENSVISATVKSLVTTALDISDDKVCVSGLDIS